MIIKQKFKHAKNQRVSSMKKILDRIDELRKGPLKKLVRKRLKEFSSFKAKDNHDWFSELCFCILTANSKASTAIEIQKQMGKYGFQRHSQNKISRIIRDNGHRFHNNKAKYIKEALKLKKTKELVVPLAKEDPKKAREWLVANVKGIGYKEASHFLRNVGYSNVAILDRHIINTMIEHSMLKEKPKVLNKKNYLDIESKLYKVASKVNMNHAELDLYLWYMKTGKVLK